jgi:hypothetical protein
MTRMGVPQLEMRARRQREHLRGKTTAILRITAASVEGAQVSTFDEHLRRDRSKVLIEHDHLSVFVKGEDCRGSQPRPVAKMLNSPGAGTLAVLSTFGHAGSSESRLKRDVADARGMPYVWKMNFPAYTDPALEIRPASAFVGFCAALANMKAPGEVRLAEAESALAEGEADINRGVEAIARLIANHRVAAESDGRVDWDYLIERLEFYETEAARDLSRIQKLIDRILMFVRDTEPAISHRARGMARRQENAVARFVEALRDARWQTMALRAHSAPDSRAGPIFDNPTELRRTLRLRDANSHRRQLHEIRSPSTRTH